MIDRGEFILVTGKSDSGKSALIKLLLRVDLDLMTRRIR